MSDRKSTPRPDVPRRRGAIERSWLARGALIRGDAQGISHRTTFLESADLAAFRAEIEGKFGVADDVKIRGEYRVWTWRRDGLLVMLSSYAKGVTLTAVAPTEPTASPEQPSVVPEVGGGTDPAASME